MEANLSQISLCTSHFYFEAIRIEKVICATFTELVFD